MKISFLVLAALAAAPAPLSAQFPTMTNQPASQAVWAGGNATFTVGVSGAGPFVYQWQFNGTNVPNGIITTVAGGGNGGDGGPATNASLYSPYGVAVDASGDVFIADTGNNRIREVKTNGMITTVAGKGNGDFSGDGGPATNASLALPSGVAVDGAGNLFIADTDAERIREVSTNGIITTVAGNGLPYYSGDGGPATNASLNSPEAVAVDTNGNLFIADTYNYCIREVDTNGIITTLAGNNINGFSGDGGPATNASMSLVRGVAVDHAGNVFAADEWNNRIRKISPDGIITTLAGGGNGGDGGYATNASLARPNGVAVDANGNLFITDMSSRVQEAITNGIIMTVAGNGTNGFSGDGGNAISASLFYPSAMAVDNAGNLLIADTFNDRIRKVVPDETPTLEVNNVSAANAGNYQVVASSSGGSVTSSIATLAVATITSQPASSVNAEGTVATFSVAVGGVTSSSYQWLENGVPLTDRNHASGSTTATLTLSNVQPADAGSYLVAITNVAGSTTSSPAVLTVVNFTAEPVSRAVWVGSQVSFMPGVVTSGPVNYQWLFNSTNLPNGIITTVAGDGTNGFFGDGGPATGASLAGPFSAAVDNSGNLFIADTYNYRVREVSASGIITTVAGNGVLGHSPDGGLATNTAIGRPAGLASDAVGNVFFADSYNNWVWKVNANGIIVRVAGNYNSYGYSGDGGAATNATLNDPLGLSLDAGGDLFIADAGNDRIRMVDTNGIITTVAGNGTAGYSGDHGAATNASLGAPNGVAADANGDLFIADTMNMCIRKVNSAGVISTVAGFPHPVPGVTTDSGFGTPPTDADDSIAATNAWFFFPAGVAVDTSGNVFISDTYDYQIDRLDTNGIVTTIAGKGPGYPIVGSYSGDGGPATNANLNLPEGLAVDVNGNVFFADSGNNRVREVFPSQGPALVLNDVTTNDTGTYQLAITGASRGVGNVTSAIIHLVVTASPLIYGTIRNSDGSIDFNCVSRPSSTNVVLCATNLLPPVAWQSLSTNNAGADGDWQFTDTNAASHRTRFYQSLSH